LFARKRENVSIFLGGAARDNARNQGNMIPQKVTYSHVLKGFWAGSVNFRPGIKFKSKFDAEIYVYGESGDKRSFDVFRRTLL
jgi:hypothetical protein